MQQFASWARRLGIGQASRARRLARGPTARWACLGVLALACALAGCEDTSHDNIDKWMRTEKGPGKLADTLKDGGLDPDLSAHAAQNLIRMDKLEDVLGAVEAMPKGRRGRVLAALVPRLWDDARIEGELTVPSPSQIVAKDALFELRRFAVGDTGQAIEQHLADWLTEGYYSARARMGRVTGATIVRLLGPKAAPGLIRRAKAVITAPPDEKGARIQIEDPLLLGLAATGDPEATAILMDLVTSANHPDKTTPKRAMDALFMAYVNNDQLFELADPKGLQPHVARLIELALSPTADNHTINDAIRLVGAAGPPACIAPLVALIAAPDKPDQLLWVSANAALQCAKAAALVPVADALPRRRDYTQVELFGAVIDPALALGDKQSVARGARTLLGSQSWVSRLIGIEILGRLELADSASDDAAAVRALTQDKTRLRGWWGDQEGVPKRDRKPDPRLGERAEEVAAKLDQIAKSG